MLITARVLEACHPVILSDDLLISSLCLQINRINMSQDMHVQVQDEGFSSSYYIKEIYSKSLMPYV